MSWPNSPKSELIETVSRWMSELARHYAITAGAKGEYACALAAGDLGLTGRRGRSFLHREPVGLRVEEFQEIARRRDEYLVRRARELISEGERLLAESKRASTWENYQDGQANCG